MRTPVEPLAVAPLAAKTGGGVPAAIGGAALRAYLVEDNRVVRENLIAALEELAPLRVVGSAEDERVARAWMLDDVQACDLMIIDLFLNSGSGLGVLAAARARWPDAALVVLSNYATEGIRARCLATGADRVFDKSCDIELLVSYCTHLAGRGGGICAH